MALKVGDQVILKSGGPTMTVVEIGYNENKVRCAWFDGDRSSYTFKSELFPQDALKQANFE